MRTLMAALRSLSRERPYSAIRGIFHGGHVFATMIRRVRVNAVFACMGCSANQENEGGSMNKQPESLISR